MPLVIPDEVLKAAAEGQTIKWQGAAGIIDTGVIAPPTPPGPAQEVLDADVKLALEIVLQPYSSIPSGQYIVNNGDRAMAPCQNSRQVAGHIEAIVNDAKYAQMGGRPPADPPLKYTGTVEITMSGMSPISLADIVAREK